METAPSPGGRGAPPPGPPPPLENSPPHPSPPRFPQPLGKRPPPPHPRFPQFPQPRRRERSRRQDPETAPKGRGFATIHREDLTDSAPAARLARRRAAFALTPRRAPTSPQESPSARSWAASWRRS